MTAAPTALVIEDDAETAALITALLQECGVTVYAAGNGSDGVAAVRKHGPVLVTMDLGLPGMDGFEAARQIRQFGDAYMLVISASNTEQDLIMAFSAGADDYLTKPFRPAYCRPGSRRCSADPVVCTGVGRCHGGQYLSGTGW